MQGTGVDPVQGRARDAQALEYQTQPPERTGMEAGR